MAFNRNQVDLDIRSSRNDANLDFPFLPFYRKINYITLDNSTTVLSDGYFDTLSILKLGDLIHIVIVDHLNPPDRVVTPIYLLVQVIDIDPVIRVRLILSNEGTTGLYSGIVNVGGLQFTIFHGMITDVV